MQKPRIIVALIGLTVFILPAPSCAVEVYRCITNTGTIYQEKPCSGMLINFDTAQTGVGSLRTSEVGAYLDAVEHDVRQIEGPHQSRQLETVNGHLTILRRIVD